MAAAVLSLGGVHMARGQTGGAAGTVSCCSVKGVLLSACVKSESTHLSLPARQGCKDHNFFLGNDLPQIREYVEWAFTCGPHPVCVCVFLIDFLLI